MKNISRSADEFIYKGNGFAWALSKIIDINVHRSLKLTQMLTHFPDLSSQKTFRNYNKSSNLLNSSLWNLKQFYRNVSTKYILSINMFAIKIFTTHRFIDRSPITIHVSPVLADEAIKSCQLLYSESYSNVASSHKQRKQMRSFTFKT